MSNIDKSQIKKYDESRWRGNIFHMCKLCVSDWDREELTVACIAVTCDLCGKSLGGKCTTVYFTAFLSWYAEQKIKEYEQNISHS